MQMTRFTRDRNAAAKLTPEEKARLDVMSDEQFETNAAGDADNPPMTDEEWARGRTRWLARKAREAAGLSQAKFAKAFHLNVRTLQGWEAGRFAADSSLRAYLQVIMREPAMVRAALSRDGEAA